MKLSTRARYGLRAMIELAMRSSGAPVEMRSIAAGQDLSKRYLDNIFSTLRRAGLVRSVRGAFGGYQLTRPAAEIPVDEVVEALEGDLLLVPCDEEFAGDCARLGHCATSEVWQRASQAMRDALAATSLQDLVDRQRALDAEFDAAGATAETTT